MKLFKVYTIVAVTHLGVIFLLLVQPGCQHSPKSESATKVTPTERVTHPAKKVTAGDAQNRTTISQGLRSRELDNSHEASAHHEVAAESTRELYPPTRPVEEFNIITESQPEIIMGNDVVVTETIDESFNSFAPPAESFETVDYEAINQQPVEVIEMDSGIVNPELNTFSSQTYTVVKGDNLTKIAKTYGVSLGDLMTANGLNKKSILKIGQILTIPGSATEYDLTQIQTPAYESTSIESESSVYIVVPGDSLSRIAKKHSTTVATIKSVNGLTSNTIYAGQDLLIPKGTVTTTSVVTTQASSAVTQPAASGDVYVVKKGDSLSKIAKRLGMKVSEIMERNGISNPHRIRVGQKLNVSGPVSSPAVSSSPAPTAPKEEVIYEVKEPLTAPTLDPAMIEPSSTETSTLESFDDINLDDVPVVPIEPTEE